MITSLDWGNVTPEFFNKEKNSAVHVFNHSLVDEESVERSILNDPPKMVHRSTHCRG